MKIVVTGATGHIGSYVIKDLAKQFPGSEVVMIDNMITQRYPSLFNLPSGGRYKFIEDDVITMDLHPVLKDAHVVIHLAAITNAAASFENAAQVEENNYLATLKVSEACLATNTRFMLVSSTSVYGTQNKIVAEDCSPEELQPQSPYATTKLKEEELIVGLCAKKGLKGMIFRFGTIFGVSAGIRFHTAVNKFCWQAVMGQPITVWSTVYEQKRPYLDLSDASKALCFMIHKDIFDGRIYNVLTQNATVKQVVDTIREFVPALEIQFVDNKIMNQLSYEVSCERFRSLGFNFSGDLHHAIEETIALLRQANYTDIRENNNAL